MVQPVPSNKERKFLTKFFKPDHFFWFIITNQKYNVLRAVPGCEGHADLDAVKEDAKNVTVGILGLGARKRDIVKYKNCTFDELVRLFKDLTNDIRNNWKRGNERTFVFIYYAGHGVLKNFT